MNDRLISDADRLILTTVDSERVRVTLQVEYLIRTYAIIEFGSLLNDGIIRAADWFVTAVRHNSLNIFEKIIDYDSRVIHDLGTEALKVAVLNSSLSVIEQLVRTHNVKPDESTWYAATLLLPSEVEFVLSLFSRSYDPPSPRQQSNVIGNLYDRKLFPHIKLLLEAGWTLSECTRELNRILKSKLPLTELVNASEVRDEMEKA